MKSKPTHRHTQTHTIIGGITMGVDIVSCKNYDVGFSTIDFDRAHEKLAHVNTVKTIVTDKK